MQQIILAIHVIACISIVILVLIQHGKGAEMGAAFGGGASGTVFGSQGSGSFLLKFTSVVAIVFFATSISLGYLAARSARSGLSSLHMQQVDSRGFGDDADNVKTDAGNNDKKIVTDPEL